MRHIDQALVGADERASELISAAETLGSQLREASDDVERRELIDKNHQAWTAFRPIFEDLFGPKCWYTESTNAGTDDDVDHFRPKKKLTGHPEHRGYWWEAFNWENFRLSCHRANRRRQNPETGNILGKGNHFPLLDEALRWQSPDEVCREQPTLLDPTKPDDPSLITFDLDGRVAITPAHEGCPVAVERVNASRELLHLDWPDIVRQRRDLYVDIRDRVRMGDDGERAALEGAAAGAEIMRKSATALVRLTAADRPYSRAAAAFIRIFKDRAWVEQAVLPNIPAQA